MAPTRMMEGATSARLRDLRSIVARSAKEFGDDQIPLIAAGVTFYTVLALFPALAAFASLYGLFADLAAVDHQLQALSHILPGGALTVVGDQLKQLALTKSGGLSFGFALGLVVALWSANGAISAAMTGLNVAYELKEQRGFIRRTLISLAFTVGLITFAMLAAGLLATSATAARFIGVNGAIVLNLTIWAALLVAFGVGLALLYRFGPNREATPIRWITWGAITVVVAWGAMSALFSLYVANFGHYNKTYGSLGAAVGLMTWLWLSYMVMLGGAELNNEIEALPKAG